MKQPKVRQMQIFEKIHGSFHQILEGFEQF